MSWWWCLTHQRVEQGAGCPDMERLGPYGSQEEAAGAPARTAARTAEQDARDRAEDDWGKPPAR